MQSELQCIGFELRCFDWILCSCIIPYNSKNNFVMSWECLGQLPSIWWSLVSKRGIVEHFLFSLSPAFSSGYGRQGKSGTSFAHIHEWMKNLKEEVERLRSIREIDWWSFTLPSLRQSHRESEDFPCLLPSSKRRRPSRWRGVEMGPYS